MARSRCLTVEDIPQLVDAIVIALERRMLAGANPSPELENFRCDRTEKESMDRTDTATDGGSSSLQEEAARRLFRFRRRAKPDDTRPLCRKRSKAEP